MGFTKQYKIDFDIIDNQIVLSNNYFQKHKGSFRKITGTRFGKVIGISEYETSLKTWANMVKIYEDEFDETLSRAGQVIEPKIRDYVIAKTGFNFHSYDPKEVKWDLFPENPVFGGIPDGEPVDVYGKLAYDTNAPMLEIKTTSCDSLVYKKINGNLKIVFDENGMPIVKKINGKKDSWFDSNGKIVISPAYYCQIGLYLYLRNITKGMFAIAFLEPQDYVHPEWFEAKQRDIRLVPVQIDRKAFEVLTNKAQLWYNSFIRTGKSPQLTSQDWEWLRENGIA
ncbi:MPN551 family DNA-binding protein [Mycoplasmoides pneumoniae]|uniref:Uncharacterized protein MG373 homolog n=3 Tax=Mycoplasmoides pneumoniae TaxID=2104 RepID=Y551_MYCPN|nr:YqaJ viral recombinase family protein [Mycoplasmoides pneumoniae]P75227.1 RecName: Full=Uncharacterized protein MG373 homolog [Mycoplasmoides pneumoniae M129]AAB95939.1 conserved hypothetical protein [Mycoplasmoides pneumoniae M129]ADK87091.1 conserved hypothetical protein [Mycoplasmoides pneumoniae FH]AGC04437.1 hypothetical protein C985_0561 [Mycoplasmoides pneumoniae M129-B7]ALA30427.1 hypothetical protein C897_03160 [Mycoplasmoides pneumoniae PI 1428]ALA30713.1 hypothetical protein B43